MHEVRNSMNPVEDSDDLTFEDYDEFADPSATIADNGPESNVGAQPPRFAIRRESDLRNLPPVKWLISGIIPEGTLSVLYGPYGCGKSFVALDMALSLDTGRAWHDHKVQPSPGRVIYIAAEGVRGILQRVEVWKLEHRVGADTGLLVIGDAPQLPSADDIGVLAKSIRDYFGPDINPRLVVIDTLARSMDGYDENQAKDMNFAIKGATLLQRAFGCHVMLVHHTGKVENGTRGSNTLPSAAETAMPVTSSGNLVKINCKKQKDAKEFPELTYRLKTIELPGHEDDDEFATNASSCVLVDDVPEPTSNAQRESQFGRSDHLVLKAFASYPSLTELRHVDIKNGSSLSGGVLERSIEKLIRLGYIYTVGEGKTKRYIREVGTNQTGPIGTDDEPENGEDSDSEFGPDDEWTNVDQCGPIDSPHDQGSLVHGPKWSTPFRGGPFGPSGPTPPELDIAGGKRTKKSTPKKKMICAQCGIPGTHEMMSGHILCKSHWEAYCADEDTPNQPCSLCGKHAWGFALGGPENGYVCSWCLPRLLNGKQDEHHKASA